ncbi:hypothetical protein ACFO5K_25220 [Nocardia halotolerans]|uniref:Uncharacterized protein n=1 Tax=Nocardia halotolerans TaxID=1755878 RepID=A0ABV8VNN0_9NOCA
MIYLDLAEVVAIARAVNKTPHAVADIGLLAGAVERPKATVFGQEVYPGCSSRPLLSCIRSRETTP